MKGGNLHWRNRDLTGQQFGLLTAVEVSHSDGHKLHWIFRCSCGELCVKVGTEVKKSVRLGGVPNCGCHTAALMRAHQGTHRMTRHPAYAVYRSMIDRCRLPTHQAWKNYGARGIRVCDRWAEGFENFWEDMGSAYEPGLTLDRTDNNGNYSPENCRWVTMAQQVRNRRNSRRDADFPAILEKYGLKRTTADYRLKRGIPLDRPLQTQKSHTVSTTS